MPKPPAHLLAVADRSPAELTLLLDTADRLKRLGGGGGVGGGSERWARRAGPLAGAMSGLAAVMLFEKPSLRTRVSFEVGIARLGGHPVYYDHSAERLGLRETLKDVARNLERFCSVVVARVFEHAVLVELAAHSGVPVINALSNDHHPCQALADMMTLRERHGKLAGLPVCFIGDGNNVCHSLMEAACALGAKMTVITPPGFEPSPAVVARCEALAGSTRTGGLRLSTDPGDAAGQAAVYTDTWVSMHQSGQGTERVAAFAGYQVNEALMARAARGAIFMHCLPAHRGEEVTDAVIDSAASAVYDQAENRMHAQMAVLLHTLGAAEGRAGTVPAAGATKRATGTAPGKPRPRSKPARTARPSRTPRR